MLKQNWFYEEKFEMFEECYEDQYFFDTETKAIYIVSEDRNGTNIRELVNGTLYNELFKAYLNWAEDNKIGLVYHKMERGDGYYSYRSGNKINYSLLQGNTIGDGEYASETLFIMLDIDFDIDPETERELFKIVDCTRVFVDFFQLSGSEEMYGLEEKEIKEAVDKFEADHKQLIEFIKHNNIKTLF